jgi:hypothetical protein
VIISTNINIVQKNRIIFAAKLNKMREVQANNAIKNLQTVIANGFDGEKIIENLLIIRKLALLEEDPTIVKICRLVKEYIETNEHFDLGYVTDEEIGDLSDLEYLTELMLKVEKPENREEIQEIRDRIKAALY